MDSFQFSSLEIFPGEKYLGAKQISKNFHFPCVGLDKNAGRTGDEPHACQENISEFALSDVHPVS